MLRLARDFGSRLVVGVYDDAYTRKLKGPARPIARAEARLQVVEAVRWVDKAVLVSEPEVLDFMAAHRGAIFAKGQESRLTRTERGVAQMLAMEIRFTGSLDRYSTTSLVMRRLAAHTLETPYVPPTSWLDEIRQEAIEKGYIDPETHENLLQAKL